MRYHTILHVDDDLDDCGLFLEALRTVSDANYICIPHPVNALAELDAGIIAPDVIIVDFNMPIINGLEFLSEVKRMRHLQNIPIIIMSTCSQPDTEERALKYGAADYIVKPTDFLSLQKMVRQKF